MSPPRSIAASSSTLIDLHREVGTWLAEGAPMGRPTTPAKIRLAELVLNLRGREWGQLRASDREFMVEVCFQYWRARGFPYYSISNQEMVHEYSYLEAVTKDRILLGDEIQSSMVGVRLANYFHPQMWMVKMKGRRSPYKCFEDDDALRRLIRRSLTVWADRYAVNATNLRGMLLTFSHTGRVSNFRPTAAKAIYEEYSKQGDTVIDFSAGYGGRMLGCLPLDRRYIGIDPCREQINGLRKMKAKVGSLVKVGAETIVHRACAEDFLPGLKARSAALVFSSPPYFNMEQYSHEKSQSYIRFPRYEQWLESFLGTVILESKRILKRGGHLVVNVANINGYKLADDMLGIAKLHFSHIKTLRLRLGHLPYLRADPEHAYKYEPVLVFRKD